MKSIGTIHEEWPDKGYRRIRDDLERDYGLAANDKRILRLCRIMGIKSCIKSRPCGCTVNDPNPAHLAENVLNRKFTAEASNEKWLTDVTEFKYYLGMEKHKVYLSAILALYDRRIIAYVIRDSNNNSLVFDTFVKAVSQNPEAHPLYRCQYIFPPVTYSASSRLAPAYHGTPCWYTETHGHCEHEAYSQTAA